MATTQEGFDCPALSDEDVKLIDNISYWVEGVLQSVVAFIGIISNLTFSYILTRRKMLNCFNILLVSLSAYDTWYLFGSILESCRKYFEELRTDTHIILFPYFLYPMHQTSITGSIYMTVAIALERYIAVHYPLHYNHNLNNTNAMRNRVAKYLVPVFIFSLLFNIPKFFESEVEFEDENAFTTTATAETTTTESSINVTFEAANYSINKSLSDENNHPSIQLTDLRINPVYSSYNSWSRFFMLGLLPFSFLVFFNVKIYRTIQERTRRRVIITFHREHELTTAFELQAAHLFNTPRTSVTPRTTGEEHVAEKKGGTTSVLNPELIENCVLLENRHKPIIKAKSRKDSATIHFSPEKEVVTASNTAHSYKLDYYGDSNEQNAKTEKSTKRDGSLKIVTSGTNSTQDDSPQRCQSVTNIEDINCNNTTNIGLLRRKEDSLAIIFMPIIIIFLVCNFPRILLDIHELATFQQTVTCRKLGLHSFSVWSLILLNFSHFLLVINSTVNLFVYCTRGSRFRREFFNLLNNFVNKL